MSHVTPTTVETTNIYNNVSDVFFGKQYDKPLSVSLRFLCYAWCLSFYPIFRKTIPRPTKVEKKTTTVNMTSLSVIESETKRKDMKPAKVNQIIMPSFSEVTEWNVFKNVWREFERKMQFYSLMLLLLLYSCCPNSLIWFLVSFDSSRRWKRESLSQISLFFLESRWEESSTNLIWVLHSFISFWFLVFISPSTSSHVLLRRQTQPLALSFLFYCFKDRLQSRKERNDSPGINHQLWGDNKIHHTIIQHTKWERGSESESFISPAILDKRSDRE
jgi:hypothetical protein